jgi:hypothetical protein
MLCVQEKLSTECDDALGLTPVHLAPAIVLTKSEVIEACDGLARTSDLLLSLGRKEDASWAARLFECLEDRLALA